MDHNKQSNNNLIEVWFKAEVEEILDGNRLSLISKSLDSSLKFDNTNFEDEISFNKVTGRSKQKNKPEFTQEEKPQKANRSEVRQVKNILEELIHQRKVEQEYKREEQRKER